MKYAYQVPTGSDDSFVLRLEKVDDPNYITKITIMTENELVNRVFIIRSIRYAKYYLSMQIL